MRFQRRQNGRGPRSGRGGQRSNEDRPRGPRDNGSRPFRGGQRDENQGNNRGSGRRDNGDRNDNKVNRRISKNREQGKNRANKRDDPKKSNIDLDGQLMNYWVKGGKGQDEEGKNLANQKLNQQLDNYWKAREQNAQKVEQKPAQ